MKLRKMLVCETDDQGAKIKHLSAKWYAVFVDSSEALRRLPLLEDRKASEEMAWTINAMNSIRASGDTMPPELARDIATMPPLSATNWLSGGFCRDQGSPRVSRWRSTWATGKRRCWRRGTRPAMPSLSQAASAKCSLAVGSGCGAIFGPASYSLIGRACAQMGVGPIGRWSGGSARRRSTSACKRPGNSAGGWCAMGERLKPPLPPLQGLNVKTDRRHDTLPLRADPAALLKAHLAGKRPHAQAVAAPNRAEVSRMFRAQGGANPGPPFGDYLDDGPPHAPVRREPVGGAGRAARPVRRSPANGCGDGNG